jgi:hypothetical protein
MINIMFAVAFMAVSLAAALGIATLHDKPKPFIYAVGLASMLGQIVVLFAVLQVIGSPFPRSAPSTLANQGTISESNL